MEKNNKINININKNDSNINEFLYSWGEFGDMPNKIIVYNSYLSSEFKSIISNYIENKKIFTEIIPDDDINIINDQMFVMVNESIYLSYLIIDSISDESIIHEIKFFFKDYEKDIKLVNEIINKLNKCVISFPEEEDSKLSILNISKSEIEIEPIICEDIDVDNIELFYSKNTLKNLKKTSKLIKKTKRGLSIFYGPRGTGKTNAINYISDKIGPVIFIPNNLLENILRPEFKKFIVKYPKTNLIIDDCELQFNEFFSRSNIVINNLLQILDGISDIEVNIIIIFNTDRLIDIDHSLLECNNLINIVEFEYLDEELSNELAIHIGNKKKYKNKTKLIDIIKSRNFVESKNIGL